MWAYRKCHKGIVTFLIDLAIDYDFRNTSFGIDKYGNRIYPNIMICPEFDINSLHAIKFIN